MSARRRPELVRAGAARDHVVPGSGAGDHARRIRRGDDAVITVAQRRSRSGAGQRAAWGRAPRTLAGAELGARVADDHARRIA